MDSRRRGKQKKPQKLKIHQKRRLLQARIESEKVFERQPINSVQAWVALSKKAGLSQFPPSFLFNEWNEMVGKYNQLKPKDEFGKYIPLDDEAIHTLTQQWEFFQPLHRHMTTRDAIFQSNLPREERSPPPDEQRPPAWRQIADQDYYDRKKIELQQLAQKAFVAIAQKEDVSISGTKEKQEEAKAPVADDVPSTSRKQPRFHCSAYLDTDFSDSDYTHASNPQSRRFSHYAGMSARDKYYRHKRNLLKIKERRIECLLNMFGHIVHDRYPSIKMDVFLVMTSFMKRVPMGGEYNIRFMWDAFFD